MTRIFGSGDVEQSGNSERLRGSVMKRKCYHHPQKDALANCLYCGRFLCHTCLQKRGDVYCCKDDYDCLSFQEKENEIELLPLEEVIQETKIEKELTSWWGNDEKGGRD